MHKKLIGIIGPKLTGCMSVWGWDAHMENHWEITWDIMSYHESQIHPTSPCSKICSSMHCWPAISFDWCCGILNCEAGCWSAMSCMIWQYLADSLLLTELADQHLFMFKSKVLISTHMVTGFGKMGNTQKISKDHKSQEPVRWKRTNHYHTFPYFSYLFLLFHPSPQISQSNLWCFIYSTFHLRLNQFWTVTCFEHCWTAMAINSI